MTFENSPAHRRHDHQPSVPNGGGLHGNDTGSEVGALRAENAELRKVVIELSKLVIRNVLRSDSGG